MDGPEVTTDTTTAATTPPPQTSEGFDWRPVGGWPVTISVVGVLVLLLVLGPGRSRTSPRRRAVLVVLRAAVIALVLMALMRPYWKSSQIDKQPDLLIVLLDGSRSMGIDDMDGGKTRAQVVEEFLRGAADVFAETRDELDPQVYVFDADARRLEPKDGKYPYAVPPTGDESDIGGSIAGVFEAADDRTVAGVVLISDGANYSAKPDPILPTDAVNGALVEIDHPIPLFTIALGTERAEQYARDIGIKSLSTSAPIFVKNPMAAGGSVVVEGFDNQEVEVQLSVETSPGSGQMAPVGTQILRGGPQTRGAGKVITFEHTPTVPGEYKVTLKAAALPGEIKTQNNEVTTFVTVQGEGLSVLYVEGTARVEQNFIRRSLDTSPDIYVDSVELNARKPETRPPDLAKKFAPGQYDTYVFGDVDSTAFTNDELTALAAAVRGGAGFVMLGGIHSFGAGGYGATPLAEVLPVRMDRLERQNFGEDVRPDLHWKGPLRIKPTQIGKLQSLFQLTPDAAGQDAAWLALPPLDGANRFAGLNEGALVLATSDAPNNPPPLAVMREFGGGRVLALAVDSTWRWRMRGHEDAHRRFWRQTILWLAHREDAAGDNVWLKLPQRTFAAGATFEFETGAKDADGRPIPGALLTPVVTGPDGKPLDPPTVQWSSDNTSARGSLLLPPGAAGDYTVTVSAVDAAKKPLGSASARFHVTSQDKELEHTASDRISMEGWAKLRKDTPPAALDSTGPAPPAPSTNPDAEISAGIDLAGDAIKLNDFAEVVRQLSQKSAKRERPAEASTEKTLYDRWEFLWAFVGLLCLEWFLRKKWGLV